MSLSQGTRTFVVDIEEFGDVVRTNMLGLTSAPVVVADDQTLKGACGQRAKENVVIVASKKNLLDVTVTVPVDVRIVGIAQLTAAGVPSATQALMFDNWRTKLIRADRLAYTVQWEAASAGTPAEAAAFVQLMVTTLTAL